MHDIGFTDQKMDSRIENLTFSIKNGGNSQEDSWVNSLALKVEKCRIKCFWIFISDLSRVCAAIAASL